MRPIDSVLRIVPIPRCWRNGIHASSTTRPTSTTTVPSERFVAFAIPWWKTSHGARPSSRAHRDRDREADEEEAGDERREPAQQLPPAREPQHLRVPRVFMRLRLALGSRHASSRDADSASRYSVAWGCRAQKRRRARGRDRALQRVAHRLRLPPLGHDGQHRPRPQERGNRDGDRVRRNVVDGREVTFGHLLAPRRGFERDDLHVARDRRSRRPADR